MGKNGWLGEKEVLKFNLATFPLISQTPPSPNSSSAPPSISERTRGYEFYFNSFFISKIKAVALSNDVLALASLVSSSILYWNRERLSNS